MDVITVFKIDILLRQDDNIQTAEDGFVVAETLPDPPPDPVPVHRPGNPLFGYSQSQPGNG